MKLVADLAAKNKPFVDSLISANGNTYRPKAVVRALNACRLYGHSQLLARSWDEEMLQKSIEAVKADVNGMAVGDEAFEITTMPIRFGERSPNHPVCIRIDIRMGYKEIDLSRSGSYRPYGNNEPSNDPPEPPPAA